MVGMEQVKADMEQEREAMEMRRALEPVAIQIMGSEVTERVAKVAMAQPAMVLDMEQDRGLLVETLGRNTEPQGGEAITRASKS